MSVRMAAFGVKGNKRDFTNAVKAFLELKLEKFMNRADHATIDDAMEEARENVWALFNILKSDERNDEDKLAKLEKATERILNPDYEWEIIDME